MLVIASNCSGGNEMYTYIYLYRKLKKGGHTLEEYRIKKYFELETEIESLKNLYHATRKEIFQQTLATHISCSEERGLYVEAPRIENIVMDNMLACELIGKRIKRHEERLKYFRVYLSTLTFNEQQALYMGVASDELIAQAYDEIHEIETAICFKAGVQPPEEKIMFNDDPLLDLDLMIGALAL